MNLGSAECACASSPDSMLSACDPLILGVERWEEGLSKEELEGEVSTIMKEDKSSDRLSWKMLHRPWLQRGAPAVPQCRSSPVSMFPPKWKFRAYVPRSDVPHHAAFPLLPSAANPRPAISQCRFFPSVGVPHKISVFIVPLD